MESSKIRLAVIPYIHTMKILEYFEKAWIVAAIVSFVVSIYNIFAQPKFDNHVYFPFFCGLFCIMIFYNIRRQRKFRDEMFNNKDSKENRPE